MKRIVILSIALLTLLTSCSKEGNPQHKGKIKTIASSKAVYIEGQSYYELSQLQVEEWQWDGNELYRIDLSEDEATYNENLFYNWRHQIVRTTVPAYDVRSELEYDGRKLKRITLYEKEVPTYQFDVVHEGRHITHIEITRTNSDTKGVSTHFAQHLLGLTLGQEEGEMMKSEMSRSPKGNATWVFDLTWEKGNLTRIAGNSGSANYTYDDGINPYHNLTTIYEMDNPAANSEPTPLEIGFFMMSKNNVASSTEQWGEDSRTTQYSYLYDSGKLPTQCKSSYTYTDFDSQFNIVTYRVDETRNITYQ